MQYFIFIVNEIVVDGCNIKGLDVANELLNSKKWRYTYSTHNIKRIKPGDKVVVYIAGKGFRYFISRFTIDGLITEAADSNPSLLGFAISQAFPLTCQIKELEIWQKPLPISDIKEKLGFISDQKNWGLFFRQSTKLINEDDYNFIISTAAELNN